MLLFLFLRPQEFSGQSLVRSHYFKCWKNLNFLNLNTFGKDEALIWNDNIKDACVILDKRQTHTSTIVQKVISGIRKSESLHNV